MFKLEPGDIRKNVSTKKDEVWKYRKGKCVITGQKKSSCIETNVDHIFEGQIMTAILTEFKKTIGNTSNRRYNTRLAYDTSHYGKKSIEFKYIKDIHNELHNLNNLEKSINQSKQHIFTPWIEDYTKGYEPERLRPTECFEGRYWKRWENLEHYFQKSANDCLDLIGELDDLPYIEDFYDHFDDTIKLIKFESIHS